MMRVRPFLPAVALLALLTAGCGKEKSVKVNGVVVGPDGKGLANVWVRFQPTAGSGGYFGEAVTDEDGNFSLASPSRRDDEGILPGTYTVTLYQARPASPQELIADQRRMMTKFVDPDKGEVRPRPVPESPFHPNYSDPTKTPLTVTVPTDGPVYIQVKNDGT
jgi:hypothetical protein